ncbi:MAG: bifunctional diaminohydroxyphosphoribosylaminopyrimidine deaminase/5-amino-6-(5-phosphoribosylamino)uracil reductase RibD [Steroidobacteraceae bacterium]|nr:bifunctional diaminohydroxyphosphoribosylaminopyrimidine deaminase/5-amino-6-(5-phosphoribosylamino)uracil reductase RibD [Steroidobacteraceae bacterium]
MTDFSGDDRRFMRRAMELAEAGLYSTPPNPAVGCVLERWGQPVGEGFHARAGGAHAEIAALENAGPAAAGATAYVTLEPCSHHGRTPPCADALIAAGVSRVVVAMRDPNPAVDGGGLARLAAAGIATDVGLMADEAAELNRGFVSRMSRGRPWVTLKLGASLDGRTALANGTSKWITGEPARADVQRLRSRASAVVTGSGTVVADDPLLTARDQRFEMRGRRPLRVVLDSSLRTPRLAHVLSVPGPTLILTLDTESERAEELREAGASVESVPAGDGGLDLAAVLSRLAALECNEVLVEAGPTLAGAFLRAGLTDEIVVYMAPVVLGSAARSLFNMPELERMCDRCEFTWRDVGRVGDDLRLTLRPRLRGEG